MTSQIQLTVQEALDLHALTAQLEGWVAGAQALATYLINQRVAALNAAHTQPSNIIDDEALCKSSQDSL